ncbi:MAG: DUF3137 domain-containing protein [Fimbriimonadaceae bacterium]|nr:DUF3137 domain-containing protein [Chitinophagales bacterium]
MKSIQELQIFYQNEILPHLDELEALRKYQLRRQTFIVIAFTASVVLGLATFMPFMIIIFMLISLILYFTFYGFKRTRPDFKSMYKENIVKRIIQFIEPGLVYSAHQFISNSKFSNSKIFMQQVDIYNGEDLVQGIIGKTKVEFCELHTQDRQTDSQGKTRYVTIFKGIFFIADFNKHFSGQTYVLSDFSERFMGFFGKLFQNMNLMRPDVVRLENPEFEKYFAVYSTDELEARYILSTTLMERLVEFRKKIDANLQLSFINSSINLAVPMKKNLFEPSLRKTVKRFEDIEEYYRQILFCVNIVDELNLNTRIWTKQ